MTMIDTLMPGTWHLDSSHSEVRFTVRHLAISKVKGAFASFGANVVVPENIEDTHVDAMVDTRSLTTYNEQRDGHLRSDEFFDVEKYPTMTFHGRRVEVDGTKFRIFGLLYLRGITKPLTLSGEVLGVTTDDQGRVRAGFEARGVVNRKDYGLRWNAPTEAGGLTLGDEVTILLDGEAFYAGQR